MQNVVTSTISIEELNEIISSIGSFSQDNLINGLINKGFTQEKVLNLITKVYACHAQLTNQMSHFSAFAKDYNSKFATNNNKCFNAAQSVFKRAHKSMLAAYSIYKKFNNKIRRKYITPNVLMQSSVYKNSMLFTPNTQKIIYSEFLPECVFNLYSALESFISDYIIFMRLCKNVIDEEETILNNPAKLVEIYEENCKNAKKGLQFLIDWNIKNKQVMPDDELTCYKRTHTLSMFAHDKFHMCDEETFNRHVTNEAYETGISHGLSANETVLWSDRPEIVSDIRIIINHFDELNPKGRLDKASGKYKLDSMIMSQFMKWCKVPLLKEKLFVGKYFNEKYKGIYLPIKVNTINTAKNKVTKRGTDEKYEEFKLKLEGLLQKYRVNDKKEIEIAVNY